MKFVYIQVFVLLCFVVWSCQGVKGKYTLTVMMETNPQNKLFVFYKDGSDSIRVDSAIYMNGKFELKGRIPYPQRALVRMDQKNPTFFEDAVRFTDDAMFVFLEEGDIQVSAEKTLRGARVSGTPSNVDLQVYTDSISFYRDWLDGYRKRYGEAYRNRDDVAFISLNRENTLMEGRLYEVEKRFFDQHPGSLVALDWLGRTYNIAREKSKIIPLFEMLDEEVKNSELGQRYRKLLEETVSVEMGGIAPDFTAKNINGRDVSLSSFRGQYVLLDFWASWCGPCRKSIPFLKKMYQDLVDQGLEIISISIDKSNADWLKALDEEQLPWPCLIDTENVFAEKFDGRAIPMFILVDENGIVVEDNLRDQALKNKIEELIRNK